MAHKLYLVNFKYNNKKYFKAGITGKGDVMERFKYAIQKHRLEDFKIMKSSWFKTEQEADNAEKSLFETIMTLFPENNYVDNKQTLFHFYNCSFLKLNIRNLILINKINLNFRIF